MLFFTYLQNIINIPNISLQAAIMIVSVPSCLFWYVAFVYNDFLSLTPIKHEIFMSLLLIYLYFIFRIIDKRNIQFQPVVTKTTNTRQKMQNFPFYQLDFRIPLIYPDFASFKKTVLEKFVNLLNVFLLIVLTHRLEINVLEFFFGILESLYKAFQRIGFKKLAFVEICFSIKCSSSDCFIVFLFSLSLANIFFIIFNLVLKFPKEM